uniref:G protein-coupled receptor n=1 Tax=Pristionchus pacificus TaxID=54126 RepID=A0A8R1YX50_PRIPA
MEENAMTSPSKLQSYELTQLRMPSVLRIFDYFQTVIISICLVFTIPPAFIVYLKLLFCRQFSNRYIFKLIVINGTTELLNTVMWFFLYQLTSFDFMNGFYKYIKEFGIVNHLGLISDLAAINSVFGSFALNSSLCIAMNRMKAILQLERDSLVLSVILTILTVLEFGFTTSCYIKASIEGEEILMPIAYVTNEGFQALTNFIRTLISLATLLLNIYLCFLLIRSRRLTNLSQKQRCQKKRHAIKCVRFNVEKRLGAASIIAYATYMVYFVDTESNRSLHSGKFKAFFYVSNSIHSFRCFLFPTKVAIATNMQLQ